MPVIRLVLFASFLRPIAGAAQSAGEVFRVGLRTLKSWNVIAFSQATRDASWFN